MGENFGIVTYEQINLEGLSIGIDRDGGLFKAKPGFRERVPGLVDTLLDAEEQPIPAKRACRKPPQTLQFLRTSHQRQGALSPSVVDQKLIDSRREFLENAGVTEAGREFAGTPPIDFWDKSKD